MRQRRIPQVAKNGRRGGDAPAQPGRGTQGRGSDGNRGGTPGGWPMTTRQHSRAGVATIWVLVVLSALVAVIATTTSTYVMVRRAQRNREYKLQSEWLARSGIELAAARLLAD